VEYTVTAPAAPSPTEQGQKAPSQVGSTSMTSGSPKIGSTSMTSGSPKIDVRLTWFNKSTTRLPESLMLGFSGRPTPHTKDSTHTEDSSHTKDRPHTKDNPHTRKTSVEAGTVAAGSVAAGTTAAATANATANAAATATANATATTTATANANATMDWVMDVLGEWVYSIHQLNGCTIYTS
jgi:hypothetical protein